MKLPLRSLAFAEFKGRMTKEISSFWYSNNSLEYANRWISTLSIPNSTKLGDIQGDESIPFKNLHITIEEYGATRMETREALRQNAIVMFHSIFETYFYKALQRLIYLKPNTISEDRTKAQVPFLVAEKIALSEDPLFDWAQAMTEILLRNKSHTEMIERLCKYVKAGLLNEHSDWIESWHEFSLLRNSIVHLGRICSQELSKSNKTRYPNPGKKIVTSDSDVIKMHSVGMNICENIDKRYIKEIIGISDSDLLLSEFSLTHGGENPGSLAILVNKALGGNSMSARRAKTIIDKTRKHGKTKLCPIFTDWIIEYGT